MPQILRAARALPQGLHWRAGPCDSPVPSVEPSLQSSRCWENWKRSSRAFLAQETRRRCVQKRADCHEPAAWKQGPGRSQNALGCQRVRGGGEGGLGSRGMGAQRWRPSRTSQTSLPTSIPSPAPRQEPPDVPGRGPSGAGRASLLPQEEPAPPAHLTRRETPASERHSRGGR